MRTEMNKDRLKRQVDIMKTYLYEFCEVNGIEESELKNYLTIVSCPSDFSIMAINVNDDRDIKFGIKSDMESENGTLFGEFLLTKDKFPKTMNAYENGRDDTVTSGE